MKSAAATFGKQVKWEQLSFWRNPAAAVFTLGFPLMFLVIFTAINGNEQIELLEALPDQQKRQNALLRRLCEANEPEKADKKTVESQKSVEDEDIIRLVAER